MYANLIEPTSNIETRLTRVESEVTHLGTAVGDMRLDMREMARKIDTLTPLSANDLRGEVLDLRGELRELRGEVCDVRVERRTDLRDPSRRVDHQVYHLIGSQAAVLTIVLGTLSKLFHWL